MLEKRLGATLPPEVGSHTPPPPRKARWGGLRVGLFWRAHHWLVDNDCACERWLRAFRFPPPLPFLVLFESRLACLPRLAVLPLRLALQVMFEEETTLAALVPLVRANGALAPRPAVVDLAKVR